MRFQLSPRSMTLDELEWLGPIGSNFIVIYAILQIWQATTTATTKHRPVLPEAEL